MSANKGLYSRIGKTLNRPSAHLGHKTSKIPGAEYPDGVNAYHVDVIASFRRELPRKPHLPARYRSAQEVM